MNLKKRLMYLFQPKALVLMYHRVADVVTDPWQLSVTPQNFELHLKVLKETGNLISAKDLASCIQNKAVPNNSVCLTFDDGYLDNYVEAKPLLERYECPATYFIPTHYTGQPEQFWWDELEQVMLHSPSLPTLFSLNINNSFFEFDLGEDNLLTDAKFEAHKLWTWPAAAPTRRCELYLKIWETIRPLPYSQLKTVIQEIKSWASFKESLAHDNFPMNLHQLHDLAVHPFIDLGLHTSTHPALASHNMEFQSSEISDNKKKLENICKRPVETIAYPYGNYNATTLKVVKKLNLTAAFTTSEKITSNLADPFQIGRFQVRNLDGKEFENWLSILKKSPQFL